MLPSLALFGAEAKRIPSTMVEISRRRQSAKFILLMGLVFAACQNNPPGIPPAAETGNEPTGIVVEWVGKTSVLANSGISPGQPLVAWRRPGSFFSKAQAGEIHSIFDWRWLEIEQVPRGELVLVAPGGQIFQVAEGLWEVEVRPHMPEPILVLYQQAQKEAEAGDLEAGFTTLQYAFELAREKLHVHLASWLALRSGEFQARRQDWDQAENAFATALETVVDTTMATPAVRSSLWDAIGKIHEKHNRFDQAEANYLLALENRQKHFRNSLSVAKSESDLGAIAMFRGELENAVTRFKRSSILQEQLAPGSLALAFTLNDLASVTRYQGDLKQAEKIYNRALKIRQELAPKSLLVAIVQNNLGLVALDRQQWEPAEEMLTQALRLREELVPESLAHASSLHNLGILAQSRGDLAKAESKGRGKK